MAVRMQQRRATAEQWLLADPVLAEGEIGLETDTSSFKIGNGVDTWSLLDYFETSAAIAGTIDDYVPLTQKGAALGVATLDGTGNVPVEQLGNVPATDLSAYATTQYVDDEIAAIPAPDFTGYATETFVTTAVSNLIDSAPGALDTLNELAAALGDDADFATTVANTIADKPDNLSELDDVTITSVTQNQVLKFNGAAWVNAAAGGGILASDTAPTDTEAYPLWYNTTEGRAYIYYDSFWVELTPAIQGPTGPAGKFTVSDTAPSSPAEGDGWFDSTNARFFVYYDSYWIEAATNYKGAQGGSGFVDEEVSSNINLVDGYRYFVDTSTARTLTLPASPALGDEIQILDASGTAGTNNITVQNNSNKINGTLDSALLDVNGVAVVFIWTGSTYGWRMG